MSYLGLCGFLDSPFSLLVSFCALAGTGNSTITLRYDILEQSHVAVSFLVFLWNLDNLGKVEIDFFSEIERCFNEIQ